MTQPGIENPTIVPGIDLGKDGNYVHKDLVQVRPPWKSHQALGSVSAWAIHVKRYAEPEKTAIFWTSKGLVAYLDFGANPPRQPLTPTPAPAWTVSYPFTLSGEWTRWTQMARGSALPQRTAVEFLEDNSKDIHTPGPMELLNLLRGLRAHVNSSARTEMRADGTTDVSFSQDKQVKGIAGSLVLPETITIAIPVLKGHQDAEGKPVLYKVPLRLRASVGDDVALALRFTALNTDQILEEVFQERVAEAASYLPGWSILRGAE